MSLSKEKIKKILISRECCLGDILMTTPMVRALRKNFPNAQIDYMLGKWSKGMIENNPNISNVLQYFNICRIFEKGFLNELIKLYRTRYDLVIVGDVGFMPILTAFATGARYRAGFDLAGRGILLTHKISRSSDDKWHETKAYLELINVLGLETDGTDMDLFLPAKELEWANDFFMQNKINKDKPVICLFPGGGVNPGTVMFSKRWGERKYAQLADKLILDCNTQVVFLGSPSDALVVKRIVEQMKGSAISAAGKTSLNQAAALLKLSNLYIGNDCGAMHMSAAVGTPTISIFGPTDPNKIAPIGKEHLVVKAKINCSPCYRQTEKFQETCKEYKCMEAVLVEDVLKEVKKLI